MSSQGRFVSLQFASLLIVGVMFLGNGYGAIALYVPGRCVHVNCVRAAYAISSSVKVYAALHIFKVFEYPHDLWKRVVVVNQLIPFSAKSRDGWFMLSERMVSHGLPSTVWISAGGRP
jgi:hypothetical protein